MNLKKLMLALLSSALFCTVIVTDANAGDLLKCEQRLTKAGAPKRSKISVGIEDQVPGAQFTAMVSSGENTAQAIEAANAAGEMEVDFDSNKKNIAAGATAIPRNFIDQEVSVKVTDALGAVVAQDTVACRIR